MTGNAELDLIILAFIVGLLLQISLHLGAIRRLLKDESK